MNSEFSFQLYTDVRYGVGYSKKIGNFLKDHDFNKVLILVDEGCSKKSEYFDEVKSVINQYTEKLDIFYLRGTEEPDYDYLDEIVEKVRRLDKPDIIIGIGGGSSLDITKAVAGLCNNPGKSILYRGFDNLKVPGVPCMCIPTTAGTGSEVTINAVFTDKNEMKKLGINGKFMHATWAILDAEWTMSCPHSVAVSSGIDAMTHAIESFMCKQSNIITQLYSKEAFRLLWENLPCLVEDPNNLEKRQNILLGAYFAAVALFNSGSGISGALSYPIGVHFKVPHGIGGGIFLPSVIEFNVEAGYNGFAQLLDLIEYNPESTKRDKAVRFVKRFRAFSERIGVPKSLAKWGINSENIDNVAKLMLPLQGAFDQNPVPFSAKKDALAILKKHI